LYFELNDFQNTRRALNRMLDTFPTRHEVPMRMAFLVLVEESTLPNELRDYREFVEWYERAVTLYDERPAGAAVDIEMGMLNSTMNDLRENGWID
jgi:hypothetical protein